MNDDDTPKTMRANSDAPDFMSLFEVSELLKISIRTASDMANQKTLPGVKVGGQWRFRRSSILGWFAAQEGK